MYCVVKDCVTDTIIGPFECYEDAQSFVLDASDLLLVGGMPDLTIITVQDPQEWAMDNAMELSEVL